MSSDELVQDVTELTVSASNAREPSFGRDLTRTFFGRGLTRTSFDGVSSTFRGESLVRSTYWQIRSFLVSARKSLPVRIRPRVTRFLETYNYHYAFDNKQKNGKRNLARNFENHFRRLTSKLSRRRLMLRFLLWR